MKSKKRFDFRIYLLVAWWLLWLGVSQTSVNIAVQPSLTAISHFAVLLATFAGGFGVIRLASRKTKSIGKITVVTQPINLIKVRWMLYSFCAVATSLLFACLYLAGAFTTGFLEYFAKVRVGAIQGGELTGVKWLDTLTKAFAFPVSYGLILIALGADVKFFRKMLAVCLINLVLFSYLWQVNYPIIYLFWLSFFFLASRSVNGVKVHRRSLIGLAFAFILLIFSAVNRFGSGVDELIGAVQTYVVGYHLIGFSFYDFQLADPASILHDHSFGRSSLGFLELLAEFGARLVGIDFLAASSANSLYNDTPVPIGVLESQTFNAFGTLAFTFYRDFGIIGIAIGGFAYGMVVSYSMLYLRRSWMAASIFYMFSSAWMVGMMVSPIEQTYFWFCIVFLLGVRFVSGCWRIAPLPIKQLPIPQ